MKSATGIASIRTDRKREIVAYDNVRIEVISEGSGPLVNDFDANIVVGDDFALAVGAN